jgi:hypothetical protein
MPPKNNQKDDSNQKKIRTLEQELQTLIRIRRNDDFVPIEHLKIVMKI